MSPVKNTVRWEPVAKLRNGQEALLEVIRSKKKKQYSIQLPTGYGKSWCACIAYAALREQGRVNRVLFVVPTDQQRSQYIEGLEEDLKALGIKHTRIQRCDNQAVWVIKESRNNTSEIFVAGVQSIVANRGYYADLMEKGKWLVVADEFHHYESESAWGTAIRDLDYEVILGMSATPIRSDGRLTIFGDEDFDVKISLFEAYKEGAIRPIQVRFSEHRVTWSSMDNPEPQSCLLSELGNEWGVSREGANEYEVKKKVRYFDKYVSSIFLQVIDKWCEYESKYPRQNQILVFAMTCKHAEHLVKVFNDCVPEGFPSPFADWIGVGEGLSGNRSDKENKDILDRFQDNKLPCLIQVNKASEGFNNKRCSIAVHLDMVGASPMKMQQLGRCTRVNPAAPDLPAVVFTSEDHPAREMMESLEAVFEPEEKARRNRGSRNNSWQPQEIVIPDFFLLQSSFESERIVYPMGTPEATLDAYLEFGGEPVKQAYKALEKTHGQEGVLEIFTEMFGAFLKEKEAEKRPVLTQEEIRKQYQEQVNSAAYRIAAGYVQRRYGTVYPKSTVQDAVKVIHGYWKRRFGAQSELTIEDLKVKNEWLKELAQQVNNGDFPKWLNL